MDNGLMNGEEEQQNTTLKAKEKVHGRRQMIERERERERAILKFWDIPGSNGCWRIGDLTLCRRHPLRSGRTCTKIPRQGISTKKKDVIRYRPTVQNLCYFFMLNRSSSVSAQPQSNPLLLRQRAMT